MSTSIIEPNQFNPIHGKHLLFLFICLLLLNPALPFAPPHQSALLMFCVIHRVLSTSLCLSLSNSHALISVGSGEILSRIKSGLKGVQMENKQTKSSRQKH